MLLKLKTAPAVEPLSLAQVKGHLRVDGSDEDDYISSLIVAARQTVEELCGPLITQTWEQYENAWTPPGCHHHARYTQGLLIGLPRLQSVASVLYIDINGVQHTFAAGNYSVDTINADKPRLVLKPGLAWPADQLFNVNPIKITFDCGYGAAGANIPKPILQALYLLAAHWYEERQPVIVAISGRGVITVPWTVEALLANHRVW